MKRLFSSSEKKQPDKVYTPTVTLLVAAYNEELDIEQKIKNSLALEYPEDKLQLLFITDGSNDRTPEIVAKHPGVQLLHQPERKGKIAAVARAMPLVTSEITIYTDANTMLNKEAIQKIVRHYQRPEVGAVAGEKQVVSPEQDAAAGAGEGFYWKYESTLKRWDSELHTVVGAAGELFSIRTSLFEHVPADTLIEDFYMTLRIAQRGYRVVYEPEARAVEPPSADSREELKRKVRIAAGGIQAIVRLKALLNPFRYGMLSFQYISHRVLRWTLAPLALLILLFCNIGLALQGLFLYQLLLAGQLLFYACALAGYWLESRKLKVKVFFIPYYFFLMNYAVYAGFFRYLRGRQSVLWERAKRQASDSETA
ncbi:glycosyltransferase family 2 protein [Nafulsella turpanensis]|uniref:glycosyltransferase family 2 protein n=1 Tax=Nafulsella turpanensis TaxID=1265690 RepID=UPI002934B51B|nr:glycosyltransferase family 2 protein [Nafulsella turpanensis]